VIVGAYAARSGSLSVAGVVYVIFGKKDGFATLDMVNFVSSNSTGFIMQVCITIIDTFILHIHTNDAYLYAH
jgi:hypothetical protein